MRKLARLLVALVLLPVLPVLWIAQLVAFAPLLVLARLVRGPRRIPADPPAPALAGARPESMFDRTADVSKLHGCNTRGVRWRWKIFEEALPPPPGPALDLGAGSLRDSWELARLGFEVDAVDRSDLEGFARVYEWPSRRPALFRGGLETLPPGKRYALVTAFDVLEHLPDLEEQIARLRERLAPGGLVFVSVPNRLSLWERVFRRDHARRREPDPTGAAHVQFRTPGEWERFFSERGFAVRARAMAIGALVNDAWCGLYGIPIRRGVEPLLARLPGHVPLAFERRFQPPWLMERVAALDELLEPLLRGRWGWCLFVLAAQESA